MSTRELKLPRLEVTVESSATEFGYRLQVWGKQIGARLQGQGLEPMLDKRARRLAKAAYEGRRPFLGLERIMRAKRYDKTLVRDYVLWLALRECWEGNFPGHYLVFHLQPEQEGSGFLREILKDLVATQDEPMQVRPIEEESKALAS